jgi:hypothetical protein
MSVIRVNRTKDFTIMSNNHLRNKELSLKAKGLLSVMLSLPDRWEYSISGLCAICKENETAVKSALNELKEHKYVVVTKKTPSKKENRSRYEYIYDIYEVPQEKKDEPNSQEGDFLCLENLALENQGQYNTYISNTEKLNTYSTGNNLHTDNMNFNEVNTLPSKEDKVGVDTFSPKKPVQKTPRKKSRGELLKLQSDMVERFNGIVYRENVSSTETENICNAFSLYMAKYNELTGKVHPILSDATLESIFLTLDNITDDEHDHFKNVAANEKEEDSLYSDLEYMVFEHFRRKHPKGTDYHITHFANNGEYLKKLASGIVEY